MDLPIRQLAMAQVDCFALVDEQIVCCLGRHRDDRVFRDRDDGEARYPERPILQLLCSDDFVRNGSGDLNCDHLYSRRHQSILP